MVSIDDLSSDNKKFLRDMNMDNSESIVILTTNLMRKIVHSSTMSDKRIKSVILRTADYTLKNIAK